MRPSQNSPQKPTFSKSSQTGVPDPGSAATPGSAPLLPTAASLHPPLPACPRRLQSEHREGSQLAGFLLSSAIRSQVIALVENRLPSPKNLQMQPVRGWPARVRWPPSQLLPQMPHSHTLRAPPAVQAAEALTVHPGPSWPLLAWSSLSQPYPYVVQVTLGQGQRQMGKLRLRPGICLTSDEISSCLGAGGPEFISLTH